MTTSINRIATALVMVCCARLGAQTTTMTDSARPRTGKAQIVGVVVDSINGGYLSGAAVLLDGATRSVETDSAGRFSLDSIPPGTYQLGVFHPLLDALDVSLATKPFHVGPDSTTLVILAVPAPATLVRARCPNQNGGPGSSAVVGHVVDPETLQPLGGVEVSIAWNELEISKSFGFRNTPHVLRDTTNKSGIYTLCGLPSGLEATIKARRAAAATAEIPISLGDRPVELQARNLMLAQQDSSTKTGNAAVSGVVILEGNPPNAVSRVELEGTDIAGVTNEKGEFTLRNLPAGTRNIVARHLGYVLGSTPVDLNPHEQQHVTIKLPKYVAVMDPVLVTARRNAALDKVGFSQRRKYSPGYFLDADRIGRMHPYYVADILRQVPGLRVDYGQFGEPIVRSARDLGTSCIEYWVDDVPFHELSPGDINSFVNGGEIVAAEIYQSGMAPAQYARSGANCTTIVLWTRFRIRS